MGNDQIAYEPQQPQGYAPAMIQNNPPQVQTTMYPDPRTPTSQPSFTSPQPAQIQQPEAPNPYQQQMLMYQQAMQRGAMAPEDEAMLNQITHAKLQKMAAAANAPAAKDNHPVIKAVGLGLLGGLFGHAGASIVQSAQTAQQQARADRQEELMNDFHQTAQLKSLLDMHRVQTLGTATAQAKLATQAQAQADKAAQQKRLMEKDYNDLQFKKDRETRIGTEHDRNYKLKTDQFDNLKSNQQTVNALRARGLDQAANRIEQHGQEFQKAMEQKDRLDAIHTALKSGINDRQMYLEGLKIKAGLDKFNTNQSRLVQGHNDNMDALFNKTQNGDRVYKNVDGTPINAEDHHLNMQPIEIPNLDLKQYPQLLGNAQQVSPAAPASASPASPAPAHSPSAGSGSGAVRRIARPQQQQVMAPPPPNTGPPIVPQGAPRLVQPPPAVPVNQAPPPPPGVQKAIAQFQAMPPEQQALHRAAFQAALKKHGY